MAKRWNRTETWLGLAVVGAGVVVTAIVAMPMLMRATATPLHPDPDGVETVAHADPAQGWTGAAEEARHVVRATLTEHNLPGLSVAVGVGGDIVWAEGFGWADLETRSSVAPETQFRIGTASKVLTSAAVGLLLERERLRLDEEIQTYVPEFPKKEWPVTLRQLMGHVAGLRNDSGDEGPLYGQRCARPVDALPLIGGDFSSNDGVFADRGLLFEPGTQYRYSNYGWILVSAAVEAAAGEPFLRFMQDEIFGPLRMDGTTADPVAEPVTKSMPDRATFYFPRFGSDPRYGLHLMREVNYSCYAGAGVFLSTPSDLVRFGIAMQNGKLLHPRTVQLLQTPHRLASGDETGYGLGWDLEAVELAGQQARWIGHEGTTLGGTVASLMTFPERDLVVSVMSNISYADTETLALRIAQAFAEQRSPASP